MGFLFLVLYPVSPLALHTAARSQILLIPVEFCRGFVCQAEAQGNSLGYAMDGELVDAEFLFCTRLGEKKGGYVKVKHLKRAKACGLGCRGKLVTVPPC